MKILIDALSFVMNMCYSICRNYGFAVILFTLLSKIVLLPVSVWVQKNSIKMVKMQPDINFMKAKYFGDKDRIAEEESRIYKEAKYNPFASMIPLLVQIVLLMGLIEVIKAGMNNPAINMDFFGVNLSFVPNDERGWFVLSPLIAGFSAWLLCVAQNAANVLQSEQSKANKYGTMALSVGLSLYLGWFVAVGVAIYWVASNLMAIAQQYLLNWAINPKKYVDYERLQESKEELEKLQQLGKEQKKKASREDLKRERADYKRFFSVINKKLVFYSESNGFYKYFGDIVEYILNNTNITIHYITSDPKDAIFEKEKQFANLRAYYIGEKRLITLMMKMDADIVVMTMPDLDNYHIKRSYIRKDIEYIYIPHSMDSLNMTHRTAAMDHFDTVYCTGKHQKEEISKIEDAYGLPKKTLVEWGYCLLDDMIADYRKLQTQENKEKTVLIAPSWQKDNIVDSCLDALLGHLKGKGYKVIVRPHPQHVRLQPQRMEQLKAAYANDDDIIIQTDFTESNTVFEANIMITDWSGIALEYAFATCKPVLFIDTTMKVMNAEYQKIDTIPINIWIRDEIGAVVKPDEMDRVPEVVADMFAKSEQFNQKISRLVGEYVYHLGNSAEIGANYIIQQLVKKVSARKGES